MKDNGVSHHIRTTNHLFCGMDEEAQTREISNVSLINLPKIDFTTDYWACLSIRCISAYGWTHALMSAYSCLCTGLVLRLLCGCATLLTLQNWWRGCFFLLFLLFHLVFSCITCWHQSTTDTFMSYITFTSKNVQSSSVFLYHHNAVFSNSSASFLGVWDLKTMQLTQNKQKLFI